MKEIFNKLIASLEIKDGGYSARKLSAFAIMLCVITAHIKWLSLGNFTQLEMVLTIDYGFISVCLGLTTYESLQKNKVAKEAPKQDTPPTP